MNYYNGYQAQQMSTPNSDERIWVQSEAQAEMYLVAPSSFVRLWNINEPIFYEKSCDAMGRPMPMVTYRYEKITNTTNETNALLDKLDALEVRINALENKEVSDGE